VERSDNLRTWTQSGLTLEGSQELGGGMERVIYVCNKKIQPGMRGFIRLRVEKP
jgi:hypothetical protein